METTFQTSELDPRPSAPKPLLEGPLAALLQWQAMAEDAYSPNTLRTQKAETPSRICIYSNRVNTPLDGAIFQTFCQSRNEPYLAAEPETIRASTEDRIKVSKKPATVKRYGATNARVQSRRVY